MNKPTTTSEKVPMSPRRKVWHVYYIYIYIFIYGANTSEFFKEAVVFVLSVFVGGGVVLVFCRGGGRLFSHFLRYHVYMHVCMHVCIWIYRYAWLVPPRDAGRARQEMLAAALRLEPSNKASARWDRSAARKWERVWVGGVPGGERFFFFVLFLGGSR